MDTRRDFLKKSALLAAGAGLMPASIQRALAIDPEPGSSWQDAEHVVILMQENRSFDHVFGSLRGVRGFHDPRARVLPNGNPVWLQSNAAGETYSPFRFNIKDTKITWMGYLPHSRSSQVAAYNGGTHDGWLDAKPSGEKAYANLPLTMGYYNRADVPFYYALADAFTICDQNFCSVMSCTTPNRLYLWTGTSRGVLDNDAVDLEHLANWTTFPERLEDAGVSWRIYQNELYLHTGLTGTEEKWLSNYGDNPLEYFSQYHGRYHPRHQPALQAELQKLEALPTRSDKQNQRIAHLQAEIAELSDQSLDKLSPRERNLHTKAFTTNEGDPHFRSLIATSFEDGGNHHTTEVPKGDLLHQFRTDVASGQLPAVSWLVPPENFSDHPSSPWYGAWYLSEVFDILTKNPAVWQKTIFILCYDENDGYFDHVPPFMAPHPQQPGTGKVSTGIDTTTEQTTEHTETPVSIGLGFRVPLLIASPWSRGGYVCSQVFDHTSILQFVEKFITQKTGHEVIEENISPWRRTVCGDLTSVFRPSRGEKTTLPEPLQREKFLDSIARAQFRPVPGNFKTWSKQEIADGRAQPGRAPWIPPQEPGVRPSCALPYELSADVSRSADGKSIVITMAAGKERFGAASAGAPFQVFAPGIGRTWNYAIKAGDALSDAWRLADFPGGVYHLEVHGPNGFFRKFRGTIDAPALLITWKPDGRMVLQNHGPTREIAVTIEDLAYNGAPQTLRVVLGTAIRITMDHAKTSGWHDFLVRVEDARDFMQHYAGRIETGTDSITDPQMDRT